MIAGGKAREKLGEQLREAADKIGAAVLAALAIAAAAILIAAAALIVSARALKRVTG